MHRRLSWMLATAVVLLSITLLVAPTRGRQGEPSARGSGWITRNPPTESPRTVDGVRSVAKRLHRPLRACRSPEIQGARVVLELRGPRVDAVRGDLSPEAKACVLTAFAPVSFEDGPPLEVEVRLP